MALKPQAELDERFSDPGTTAVPWQQTLDVLQQAELFWVTTVRPDGRPHSTPLVAVWLDDALHFSTGADEQKGHNLQRNPQVLLTTGTNSWNSGVDVIVEGEAVREIRQDRLAELAAAWRTKWDGRWTFEVGDGAFRFADGTGNDQALVFRVQPTKILAFGKEPFTHTSYRIPS